VGGIVTTSFLILPRCAYSFPYAVIKSPGSICNQAVTVCCVERNKIWKRETHAYYRRPILEWPTHIQGRNVM